MTRVCIPGNLNPETGKLIGRVGRHIPFEQREPEYIYQDIPCGQCLGCRLDYSRMWASRLMLESKSHERAWFITLTYDDDHLPFGFAADPATGEVTRAFPTLRKRDYQLFMKRLRKAVAPQKVRFYAAGEYGTNTFRPHYHAILFGLDLNDLKFYKVNELKQPYYTSEFLSECWQHQGYVVVSPADYGTMLYTARYVTKKLKGFDSLFYRTNGIEPPFSLMSRKPGIGGDAFTVDQMEFDNVVLPNGVKVSHPRYFQKLFERADPECYELYKQKRLERNDVRMQQLLDSIEIPYLDYLKVQEENLTQRVKILDKTRD